MRIITELGQSRGTHPASLLTVGNFDGVHLAHQRLLRRVVEKAGPLGGVATALTFEPHPIKVIAPERAPKLLTPLARKIELIQKQGIERLVVLPFTSAVARLSALEFVRQIIVGHLRAVSVYVGPTFRFGYRQSGDTEVLWELARQEGFKLEVMPMLKVRGEVVSSTRIRELLALGRVNLAGRLLGRPFSVYGPIVAGLGVGRRHTVPTLNLAPIEEQLPKVGVYVTRTRLGDTVHDSVTNVGHKPTYGQHRLTVETFLLEFSGEVAETAMEIEFLSRLRDEIKFQNPAMLKAQILDDARRSRKLFRLLNRFRQGRVGLSRSQPSRAG